MEPSTTPHSTWHKQPVKVDSDGRYISSIYQSRAMSMGEKRRRSSSTREAVGPSKIRAAEVSPSSTPVAHADAEGLTSDDLKWKKLYEKPVDFKLLAQQDPDFAAFVKGRELNFNNPSAVQQLTKSLLKRDSNLRLDLPDDRLCPPVPNRHNYILFLKDLIDTTSYTEPTDRKVIGLDIGTGSSCIYPLLGTAQRQNWTFYATDIDEKNLEYAARNIQQNKLSHRITLLSRKPDDPLIPDFDEPVTFTMTNPPFYASQAELEAAAAAKSGAPSSICTGAPTEMVTEGGEVAFVTRILTESLTRREDVQWFTAMLGFLSSVTTLIEKIKKEGITNWAVGELVQGSKTKRWVIAWSFGGMRPREEVCRGLSNKAVPLPPPTLGTVWSSSTAADVSILTTSIEESMFKLDLLSWHWDKGDLRGVGRAPGNVWNRSWRRKKKALEAAGQPMTHSPREIFGFEITMRLGPAEARIECRWREGHDYVTFESFQGYLKNAIRQTLPSQHKTS